MVRTTNKLIKMHKLAGRWFKWLNKTVITTIPIKKYSLKCKDGQSQYPLRKKNRGKAISKIRLEIEKKWIFKSNRQDSIHTKKGKENYTANNNKDERWLMCKPGAARPVTYNYICVA